MTSEIPENDIKFQAVGLVRNSFGPGSSREEMLSGESEIIMRSDLASGLNGLQVGQQILVLFHFDRPADTTDLLQHPRGDQSRPKRGVFSLRSPQRPNRIGASVVKLLEIDGPRLLVQGLDAYNRTPVLDLKPG
jgi:L-fuculose-phosphate aldolase